MKLSLLFFSLLFLAGCASLSKEECLDARDTSWEDIGFRDGQHGWDPEGRLAMHYDACKEVRVVPDRATYMRGWSQGVLDYCTPDHAYNVGLSGSSGNSRICPRKSVALFEENVEIGLRVYTLRNDINRLHEEIRRYEKRLREQPLDRETQRDLHAKIRNRDDELSHLRMLLREAEAIPVIRY